MDIISSFREKARGKNLSVVLPEGRDERIIQALDLLRSMLADSLESQVDLARTVSETMRSNE